jgi:hypothetical protein
LKRLSRRNNFGVSVEGHALKDWVQGVNPGFNLRPTHVDEIEACTTVLGPFLHFLKALVPGYQMLSYQTHRYERARVLRKPAVI